MNAKTKENVITFKVDDSILDELKKIPNRSEFLRLAVLSALENICPLCGGTGTLTPDQQKHWDIFEKEHTIEECSTCNTYHLVCFKGSDEGIHR